LNQDLFIDRDNLKHYPGYRQQLLDWAQQFGSCSFLDSREYCSPLHRHDFLAGIGLVKEIVVSSEKDLQALDAFLHQNKGAWIFGHLGYDLKKILHGTPSLKNDPIGFSAAYFFVPAIVFNSVSEGLWIIAQDNQTDVKALWGQITYDFIAPKPASTFVPKIQTRQSRNDYLKAIEEIKHHILRGDCYELNYCQEFYAEKTVLQPARIYEALLQASPNPFSCFYKQSHSYLMCASPERYLTRRGTQLFSQPIKGTALRNPDDKMQDEYAKSQLLHSAKERSENVMVVDLVRNDLSRICENGSVRVDELFGIYSYPQVHQMISTISGTQREGISFSELLKATFPMGSMTGAPKHRVMELIEQYEVSNRGLFSGAVGYFDPSGDFDFNVVIRSILYNCQSQYLSYQVGSGITWYSQPEKEYEECLWKAKAIRKVLGENPG
jgi:para-aminobenzoate synthetase component 1